MKISKLQWDSEFFNLNIGMIDIVGSKEFDFNKMKALSKNYNLVYIFCDEEIRELTEVDKKEIFILDSLPKKNDLIYQQEIEYFSLNKHSYEDLLELTLQSGIYSRYKIDKNFKNNEYEKLYKEWIDKSITKELAIDIIVTLINNKIVGFTTLDKKTSQLADIGLVAVDKNHRGKGIAKELINKTIIRARELGFKKIQVVTQNQNKPARSLYKAAGFKSIKLTYVYHFWNYDTI